MDQVKIGKFIKEKRKEKNITQSELAEKLNITDRAISKWENGICMPDSSIIIELCKILNITINDLFCGEVVDIKNGEERLEKNLVEMTRLKQESDKYLLTLEWVIGILSIIVLFIPIMFGAFLPIKEEWVRIIIVFSGFIPALIGLHFAMKIEQTAGYYKCKYCKHKYVPTFSAIYIAPHIGRTRYMKCPKCNKYSWNKKVISGGNEND